jgi:hypothetical protein
MAVDGFPDPLVVEGFEVGQNLTVLIATERGENVKKSVRIREDRFRAFSLRTPLTN